jgi:hypothetical protein
VTIEGEPRPSPGLVPVTARSEPTSSSSAVPPTCPKPNAGQLAIGGWAPSRQRVQARSSVFGSPDRVAADDGVAAAVDEDDLAAQGDASSLPSHARSRATTIGWAMPLSGMDAICRSAAWASSVEVRSGGPRVLTQLPESCDNLHVCLFLDGKARCSVPREDCGPRREGAAHPTWRGASSRRSL